jgi:hypothetical protein
MSHLRPKEADSNTNGCPDSTFALGHASLTDVPTEIHGKSSVAASAFLDCYLRNSLASGANNQRAKVLIINAFWWQKLSLLNGTMMATFILTQSMKLYGTFFG